MSVQPLSATSRMCAESLVNQMLFYAGEFLYTAGYKIPSYNLFHRVERNRSIPYTAFHSFREAVQSNKVYLPRMSSSSCSNFAARQINAIRSAS